MLPPGTQCSGRDVLSGGLLLLRRRRAPPDPSSNPHSTDTVPDLPPNPVVHVDTDPGWRGGQSLLLRLATGLVADGHPTVVACPPEGRLWRALHGRVPCLAIPAGRSWRTVARLRALQPRLLVAHTSHAHGLCLAVSKVPLVVHRWVDAPVGRTPWSRWKYRQPRAFVACSQAIRGVLVDGGVPAHRIHVVYGGTHPPPVVSPAPDAPDILAIGARVHHKGHDILAEAARRLRRDGHALDIAIAGDGPLRPEGLRLLGHRDDIPALLAGARVVVHPSRSEGLGMAVVEAMMAGVPVVASRVGGLPEVVGTDGVLVPPNDPDALAAGVLRALDTLPERVLAGQARVGATMSTERMVQGARAVYDAATHPPGRPSGAS